MKKLLLIFLILSMLLFGCACVYAINVEDEIGTLAPEPPATEATDIANDILGAMQWVGIAIAVGMIIFAGIKYVMSGAGEKAKVKEQLVPIVIGAILISGAITVANIVLGLVTTTPAG